MSEPGGERFEELEASARNGCARKSISPITYVWREPSLLHEESTVLLASTSRILVRLRGVGAEDVNYVLFGDGTGHGTFRQNITSLNQ